MGTGLIDRFAQWLFVDQTQPGGGAVANLLGISPTSSTNAPALATAGAAPTPNSPAQPDASPFSSPTNIRSIFRRPVLGNTVASDATYRVVAAPLLGNLARVLRMGASVAALLDRIPCQSPAGALTSAGLAVPSGFHL
jgi:hypothetical protein